MKKKGRKGNKSSLPSKICVVCGRSFSRRKKREKCWEDIRYCSADCRSKKTILDSSISHAV